MLYPPSLGVQPERQSGAVNDVWTSLRVEPCPTEGHVLRNKDEILDATFRNSRLVARIEYDDESNHVCIDHPIKTINVNERDKIFQTDTGPIILPDLSPSRIKRAGRFVEVFDLAYAAFNSFDWVEFIINVPTPVSKGVTVNHYSRTRRIEGTKNSIMEIP